MSLRGNGLGTKYSLALPGGRQLQLPLWVLVAVPGGLVLGLGVLAYFRFRRPRGGAMSSAAWQYVTPEVGYSMGEEADALARLLMTETGMRADRREIAAIGQVVLNRALEYNAAVADVAYNRISPPKYLRARQKWNAGAGWDDMMARNGPNKPTYAAALALADSLLRGQEPNEIGSRTQFVHPGTQTRLGRTLPSWIVSKSQGGAARYEPIDIGAARFA